LIYVDNIRNNQIFLEFTQLVTIYNLPTIYFPLLIQFIFLLYCRQW